MSTNLVLCLVGVWIALVVAEDAAEVLPDVRFHVPFPVLSREGLDLESRATSPPDLRVKRKLATDQTACEAVASVPAYASVMAGDRLVAVDGVAISLQPFQQVIDAPIGTVVMLPLFHGKGDGNILSGFARVEIVRPQSVEFQPTSPERVADIEQWHAAVAQAQQAQLAQEQEARELQAAAENDELERQACEQRERDEQYRLELTPHERIGAKRRDGWEFRYEVSFTTRGPIGLNWDLLVTDKTVVSYVEPNLAADRVGVIAPKDQLIQLNGIDTTTMSPADVVQTYVESSPPRRLVFRCGAIITKTVTSSVRSKVQNWTMVVDSPIILREWQPRLHLATWSREPHGLVGQQLTLVAAKPITGCQTLGDMAQTPSVSLSYRGGCSFVDKAEQAIKSKANALIIVNNVKGFGRFPAKMPDVSDVDLPVTMIGKLDGELLLAVLEYEKDLLFHVQEEDPNVAAAVHTPPVPPPKLSNQEMVFRRDPAKAARVMTFWYVNTTISSRAITEFRVLPALFGGNIAAMPFRIVMAYPQDTACHPQGLGVLATQSVILVKRGGCSFGVKAKSVQTVGAAGMLMINSDESLLPLMSDPKETTDLTIWAASISLSNGTFIENRLTENKNLASFINIASSST